MVTRFSTD